MAARFKAWICGNSLARIVGSNPAGDRDVSCKCAVFCQVESATGVCLCVRV
jgi:hypothetical protein